MQHPQPRERALMRDECTAINAIGDRRWCAMTSDCITTNEKSRWSPTGSFLSIDGTD